MVLGYIGKERPAFAFEGFFGMVFSSLFLLINVRQYIIHITAKIIFKFN